MAGRRLMERHAPPVFNITPSYEPPPQAPHWVSNTSNNAQAFIWDNSHTLTIIALSSIVVLTVSGNFLLLLAVVVNRKLRTPTNYLVVSLAIADLLLGLLVLPFSATLQVRKEWIFGSAFCDIWASTDVLCCTASILSLCAISVDRYIGVTRPVRHKVCPQ